VSFFEAMAEKLLAFRNNRTPLIEAIHAMGDKVPKFQILNDKFPNGTTGPLQDICPFPAMGIFNRSMGTENRRIIAGELAKFLGVREPVPASMEGVPLSNNQNSWFFSYSARRGLHDIDRLWELFAAAHHLLENEGDDSRARFVAAYDAALQGRGVKWNISWGLFWAHPREFLSLDSYSRKYLKEHLGIDIRADGTAGPPDGDHYLDLEPRLGAPWRRWVVEQGGLDPSRVADIERRLEALNRHIAEAPRLGPQFRIGHSYVTPTASLPAGGTRDWFEDVVRTELLPLLEEYWFDAPEEARKAAKRLLEDW
jgi:hypothetical protein